MKRGIIMVILCSLLVGCNGNSQKVDPAMQVRNAILSSNGCEFIAKITADYIDAVYTFSLKCTVDNTGNLTFRVMQPESIEGITGSVSAEGGKLLFDKEVLGFSLMAQGQLSPVSGPWLMIKSMRSGYISACAQQESGYMIKLDDSYEQDSIQLEVVVNGALIPVRCDILWQGRRCLSIDVESFAYL